MQVQQSRTSGIGPVKLARQIRIRTSASKTPPISAELPRGIEAPGNPIKADRGAIIKRDRQSVASDQHRGSIILVISSGAAKITEALSPIIPAGMIAGAPFSGPSWLESVLKRRLRSQKARVFSSAVVTR